MYAIRSYYDFGGYGLFTFKNILTKYDFKTREWELVKYSDYNNIPEPSVITSYSIHYTKLYEVSASAL